MKKDGKNDMSFDGAATAGRGSSDVADRVYCDVNGASKDGCLKLMIRPEMDERAFVRAVWIYLAKQDVPFDVFDCDLDSVEIIEHQVMMDTVKFNVEYEAASLKEGSGRSKKAECVVKSTACVENGKGKALMFASADDSFGLGMEEKSKATVSFDESAFLECFESMSADSVSSADAYEAERMEETESCKREVAKKHEEDISEAIGKALGEKYRITECSAKTLERSSRMYVATEYYTTITYQEKIYTLKAFSFGDAHVVGDKIENDHSLRSYVDNRQKMYEAEKEKIEKSASEEKSEWTRTPFVVSAILFSLFIVGFIALGLIFAFNGVLTAWNGYSIGMLAGAIVAALLFVGAGSTFVVSIAVKTRRDRAIEAKASGEIEARQNEAEAAIEKFSASYKASRLELLNQKLESLNLEPLVTIE